MPLKCLQYIKFSVSICCTCNFQSSSPFFFYFGFLCLQVSSVYISTLTHGGEGVHLFRLPCSVICGEGVTLHTNSSGMWGVLTVDGPHWACHSPRWCVLPKSILLRLQGALQGHCPKWGLYFMHLPDLGHSGSQVLRRGTDPDGLHFVPFPVLSSSGDQMLGECTVQGGSCILIISLVLATQIPRCAVCLL